MCAGRLGVLAVPCWFFGYVPQGALLEEWNGVLQLAVRLRLKRTVVMAGVMMGRAAYPRALVLATIRDLIWAKLPGSDPLALWEDMEGLVLCYVLTPPTSCPHRLCTRSSSATARVSRCCL